MCRPKLVGARRGGYCYQHGVLSAAYLDRLGYGVDRLLARIGDDPARPRPRSHMVLHVRADDGRWLADVGFGAGLLEPLPWVSAAPHTQGGWAYQLIWRVWLSSGQPVAALDGVHRGCSELYGPDGAGWAEACRLDARSG